MTQAEALKPSKREVELDFLRGLAILMVVDFHSVKSALWYPFTTWMGFRPFGWIGVNIFFVLSGFLVGGLLIKEWKVSGEIGGRRFLIRRGLKLWPQYYFFLIFMLFISHRSWNEIRVLLFHVQNYVGMATRNFSLTHTWSLAVEEHAYLLLALGLSFAAAKKVRVKTVFFLIAGTALFVSALRLMLYLRGYEVFYTTHTRLDGILSGVLLAILYHHKPEIFQRLQGMWWLWLAVTGAVLVYFRYRFFGWEPLIDLANLLGIALLMLLYRRSGNKRSRLYRLIAWIGLYSYGIYMWHLTVLSPIRSIGGRLPPAIAAPWLAFAPLIFGVLIGVVFTKLIELPALKLRDRLFPPAVDSAVGRPAALSEEAMAGR